MLGLGVTELLIVLLIVLLLFGATRLPRLARSFGEASRELRDGAASSPTPAPGAPARDTRSE